MKAAVIGDDSDFSDSRGRRGKHDKLSLSPCLSTNTNLGDDEIGEAKPDSENMSGGDDPIISVNEVEGLHTRLTKDFDQWENLSCSSLGELS
jgi:hypothetical protein